MKNKKIILLILFFSVFISLAIRIAAIWGNNFPFTMDQGRDMVDLRHMVVTLSPRLIGPTTSINGVFLGPAWYYFLLPAFIVGRGDPSIVMVWQILWFQISGIFLWWSLSKKKSNLGLIAAVLYLFMPVGFYANRYFWNANAMPIFTAFFFGTLVLTLDKPSIRKFIILGLVSGISMQIEAAFGVLFFPFTFLYLLFNKVGLKNILAFSSGFAVTLLPQLLFEIRHQFIMTKVLLAEFSGQASVLGGKIPFSERVTERWQELLRRIVELSHLHPNVILIVFFVSLLASYWIIRSKKTSSQNRVYSISVGFLLFSSIFYLWFGQHLKGWYVLGLSVPLVLITSSFLDHLSVAKNRYLPLVVLIFVALHVSSALNSQREYLDHIATTPANDPSNLNNELTALDWVYEAAQGEGFKAYNYIPSVYDYNYHYLYWWYGTKTYGYQPSEVAYLPDQPEYIKDEDLLWTKTKPLNDDSSTFLIMETDKDMPERMQKWLGNFSSLCLEKKLYFEFGVEVQHLGPCPEK